MSFPKALFPAFIIGASFSLLVSAAQAQQVKVEVENLEVQLQQSPDIEFSGTKEKKWDAKEWLEIEVTFKALSADRNAEFIDELEFQYYVFFKGQKAAQPQVYTRSINVTNIPVDETAYAIAFLAPATMEKAFGKGKSINVRDAWVAVEIKSRGATVGGEANEGKSDAWWRDGRAQRVEGEIFAKYETPFQLLWYDRHVQERRER
ncbi:MAG: Amuc_1102 family pilus-like protein [Verrucomicrobiota bacterium]